MKILVMILVALIIIQVDVVLQIVLILVTLVVQITILLLAEVILLVAMVDLQVILQILMQLHPRQDTLQIINKKFYKFFNFYLIVTVNDYWRRLILYD